MAENKELSNPAEILEFTVPEEMDGVRLDKVLADAYEGLSRSYIQKLFEQDCILVEGEVCRSKKYCAAAADQVRITVPQPRRLSVAAEKIPLEIVYEDPSVLVVNKPAGMVVHPGCGNYHGTLVNAIAWHLRNLPSFDPNDPEVGLVHRIDKDTSGLLLIAKTPEAKSELGLQFFNHTTHRTYHALVWGHFSADEGRIEGNIGRDPKDRLRMTVFPPDSPEGKPAVTHFRTVEYFGYTTLVECRLETGRTHQIRAHMKHIGHPLFGDERYGGTEILRGERSSTYKAFVNNCFKLCPRQALHARTLGFVHPVTGRQMDFSAEPPADMAALLDKWRVYTKGNASDILNI